MSFPVHRLKHQNTGLLLGFHVIPLPRRVLNFSAMFIFHEWFWVFFSKGWCFLSSFPQTQMFNDFFWSFFARVFLLRFFYSGFMLSHSLGECFLSTILIQHYPNTARLCFVYRSASVFCCVLSYYTLRTKLLQKGLLWQKPKCVYYTQIRPYTRKDARN